MGKLSGAKLTSRLPSSRELALLNFAKTRINSFVKWDLINFFHLNTCALNTVESIASSIGRDKKIVEPELEDLVKNRILEKIFLDDKSVYTLTTRAKIRTLVDLFIWVCENRLFRIRVIDQIFQETTYDQKRWYGDGYNTRLN